MRKVIKLGLLIIWAIIIFYFSSQNGSASQNLSDDLLGKSFFSFLNFENLAYKDFILKYTFYFRKSAHLIEYLILGILVDLNVKEYLKNNLVIISLVICFMQALSDEIHQLFVDGRTFMIKDIFIDSFGSLLGIIICLFVYKKWKKDI